MVELGEAVRERAELLENTQWAEDLSWKEIENFAKYLNIKRVSRGATVFREGAREAYMCIVVQGSVQVIKESTNHKKKVLSVIGKGKTFGEMVIFDGETPVCNNHVRRHHSFAHSDQGEPGPPDKGRPWSCRKIPVQTGKDAKPAASLDQRTAR
ncbi:MAG: hypothetical protein CSYNP_00226 [Syntrophus sp. SKADARSKE-3]|nr:hypothetical protein [Syntrophus sp. SKADARSKE-3]